jgi:hypothetical protein
VGYELRRWLNSQLPAECTLGERTVALEIALNANDATRQGWKLSPSDLAERTGLTRSSVSAMLRRLARRGWDFRVPILTGADGRPVYARVGLTTTYAVPTGRADERLAFPQLGGKRRADERLASGQTSVCPPERGRADECLPLTTTTEVPTKAVQDQNLCACAHASAPAPPREADPFDPYGEELYRVDPYAEDPNEFQIPAEWLVPLPIAGPPAPPVPDPWKIAKAAQIARQRARNASMEEIMLEDGRCPYRRPGGTWCAAPVNDRAVCEDCRREWTCYEDVLHAGDPPPAEVPRTIEQRLNDARQVVERLAAAYTAQFGEPPSTIGRHGHTWYTAQRAIADKLLAAGIDRINLELAMLAQIEMGRRSCTEQETRRQMRIMVGA